MDAAHRARDQASDEICQITSDNGVKPIALGPQVSWKDMERWWQREEEAKDKEAKDEEAEDEEAKDEEAKEAQWETWSQHREKRKLINNK